MKNIAIHINDSNILVANRSKVLACEPGYALINGDEIITGLDAYKRRSASPHLVINSFWDKLNLEKNKVIQNLGDFSSNAEIAFIQLNNICKKYLSGEENIILIPPTHYTNYQLGLLLGVANECKIKVLGMVNPALMVNDNLLYEDQLLYLDIGLNQVFISSMIDQDLNREVLESNSLDFSGISNLEKEWSNRIAEIFILKTRFDPLYSADSEYELQKSLPNWLEEMDNNDYFNMELSNGSKMLSIEIHRDQLLNSTSYFYNGISDLINTYASRSASKKQFFLSSSLSKIPNMTKLFDNNDDSFVHSLEFGYEAFNALKFFEQGMLDFDKNEIKLLNIMSFKNN
ncbi:MAG: hypothetical protein VYC50_00800 [Pseudomonadota bacterium]|nr:hypothetical protein [Gammaproteobacteria bacterium]MEE2683628.1 hypothetical protein [Pseudomonadota bacterium]